QHQEREQAEPRGQQAEPVELALRQVVAADEYDNPVLKKMQPLQQYLRRLDGVDSMVNPPKCSHFGYHLINKNGIRRFRVVLENSNMAQLAPNQYLLAQSRSKEGREDIHDASAREIYAILVPESTMRALQSSQRRQHRA